MLSLYLIGWCVKGGAEFVDCFDHELYVFRVYVLVYSMAQVEYVAFSCAVAFEYS